MDLQERTRILYTIIDGKYAPTLDILYRAQEVHFQTIEEYKYEPWINHVECIKTLIYNSLLTPDYEIELKQFESQIEQTKVDIYKSFFNVGRQIAIKKDLAVLNEKSQKLYEIIHSLDYLTVDGFASILQQYYIALQMCDNDTSLVRLQHWCSQYNYIKNWLNNGIRELSHNEPWSSYWRVKKEDTFGVSGVLLNEEQRNLILYSKMYDSIYESPDTPHDSIINDDDALDGWFIEQKRKRDAERKNTTVDKFVTTSADAQEVFLPANSIEDIQRIEDMNTLEGKLIKKQRQAAIQQAGTLDDVKLPDQQMSLRQQAMEKFKGR